MTTATDNNILNLLLEELDIPDDAYETAAARYKDLFEWLARKESSCAKYDPHIGPQGSFSLGTVNRPLNPDEEYDLDLTCKFKSGISKQIYSQRSLKELLGGEIESYRQAKGIKKEKSEKRRCWRLEYADKLSFHMDVVPCIPIEEPQRKKLQEQILNSGVAENAALEFSHLAILITDNKNPRYAQICDDWQVNNTEGYALWFRSQMKLAGKLLQERAKKYNAATIDELPFYKWKTPLQRCVQILKRHRDQMYKDDCERKPISAIITTLAARAYRGEDDLVLALENILSRMGELINPISPRVPNPVDPREDFADRWAMPEYKHLDLEKNFWSWLEQAKIDFSRILRADDPGKIVEQARQNFSINFSESRIQSALGLKKPEIVVAPKTFSIKKEEVAQPWQVIS